MVRDPRAMWSAAAISTVVSMQTSTRVIAGICLIAAPAVQALSTFFWNDHRQGITTGALIVIATVCWIVGVAAVFRLIEPRVPRFAAIGLPVAVYGCVGGTAFGVQGMNEELFNVSHAEAVRLLDEHQLAAMVGFWISGPLFPTSMFVLGLVLARIRAVPVATGLLISAGAIAFPLSRIPREVVIAHLADLVLLIAFAHLGVLLATGKMRLPLRDRPGTPTPAQAPGGQHEGYQSA
ncbi:hypothetical protein GCM10027176_28870 [Actinoallomurus bryophytorum]